MPKACAIQLCLLVHITYMQAKVSFVKDQTLNAVFPPSIVRSVPGIPDGHLRPLGWQRKPEGKVVEQKGMPSAHSFYLKYIKNEQPGVFREALKHTPVIAKWEEDSYLKQRYGKLNISVAVKKEVLQQGPRQMTFKRFLYDYMYEDWYLANTVPQEMMEELPLPGCVKCGTYRTKLQEAELWMSSGGTSSLLHSHEDHNFHCVLAGRKDFIIIDGLHKHIFDFKENYPNAGAGHSPLDMDMINMFKYQQIAKTPWKYATLHVGDCIFVPAGYLHQVRSYGRGISVTALFAPSIEFDSSDCEDEYSVEKEETKGDSEEQQLSLADVRIVWTYVKGHTQLNDTKLEPETMRKHLNLLLRNSAKLHFERFEHFYNKAMDRVADRKPAEEVFVMLTTDENQKFLSRDEIRNLSTGRLVRVANIFNQIHEHEHDEL